MHFRLELASCETRLRALRDPLVELCLPKRGIARVCLRFSFQGPSGPAFRRGLRCLGGGYVSFRSGVRQEDFSSSSASFLSFGERSAARGFRPEPECLLPCGGDTAGVPLFLGAGSVELRRRSHRLGPAFRLSVPRGEGGDITRRLRLVNDALRFLFAALCEGFPRARWSSAVEIHSSVHRASVTSLLGGKPAARYGKSDVYGARDSCLSTGSPHPVAVAGDKPRSSGV
jgi:hypothetical protein